MQPFSQYFKNIHLSHLLKEPIPLTDVIEIFCIDTSTSMWYSDNFFSFLGTSRIEIAKDFCIKTIKKRIEAIKGDKGHVIILASFDSDFKVLARSDSDSFDYKKVIYNLQPTGEKTALYDAVSKAHEEIKKYYKKSQLRLFILTDGYDNFSTDKAADSNMSKIRKLKEEGKKLNIATLIFALGGNLNQTKAASDKLGAEFFHLTKLNVDSHITSFLNRFQSRAELIKQVLDNLPPCSEIIETKITEASEQPIEKNKPGELVMA